MNHSNQTPSLVAVRDQQILLLTLGTTPQVVTETLFALAARAEPFLPDEIHLITTREGERQAQLRLLDPTEPAGNHLARLCAEIGLDLPRVKIHLIEDDQGRAMDDIRSVDDQDQAANLILAVMRKLTAAPECALHVSLAGGRKTMGFYLAYALSLYGREQDELSHVLVNAPFESLAEFFYPPKTPRILALRDGKTISTDEARIMLAPIPYVRLRGLLPASLISGEHDYRALVRRTQTRISGTLHLHAEDRAVDYGGERLTLSDTQFIWLYWFAQRAKNNKKGAGENEACKNEVMACVRALEGVAPNDARAAQFAPAFDDSDCLRGDYLRLQVTRINNALKKCFGLHTPLRIVKEGRSSYRLPLLPHEIEIHR